MEAKAEKVAEAALNERLSMMDELNKAKLRIFLDAKRLGKMSSFYSHWKNIWMNRELIELYEMLEKEEELRKQAEEELLALQNATGNANDAASAITAQVDDALARNKAAEMAFRNLNNEMNKLQRRIRDLQEELAEQKISRANGQEALAVVRAELAKTTAERDELAGELMGIAGEVKETHKDTEY